MDTYTRMVDCPEIQGQRKGNRFYVKEDIWGLFDSDAEERKQDAKVYAEWYNRKYPKKPPYKQEPLLRGGDTVIEEEMLGEETGDGVQITVWTVLANYPDKFIWLPRQEDIQEMLLDATGVPYEWLLLVEAMVMWVGNSDDDTYAKMNLDELWLCYYMHEVHSKRWTEKGWK